MTPLARSLGGQIANTLRTEILSGRVGEGASLLESQLASRFGTSRGPVRDALAELTKEGLLVPQSRGVAVAGSAPSSIQNLVVPIRRTIECYGLELCFAELADSDFQNWDEILEQLRRACVLQDLAALVEQDIALHRSILERSGQPDLVAIWMTIVARIRRHFMEACERYPDLMQHFVEHQELLRVFRSGDKHAALKALEAHIR